MEKRKQKEIEYFDKEAEERIKNNSKKKEKDGFEEPTSFLLESFVFVHKFLKNKCKGKKILDYGCGSGIHSIWLAEYGGEVVGIDLSEKSLAIAKEKARKLNLTDKLQFLLMDCEKLSFPNDSFDIIFDGGTFSSLDINKVFPEINRVLKPGGFLIGIETLGHNPFTNFKRKINEITGKRTKWAARHIFRIQNLKEAKEHFNKVETYFFHFVSWLAFPFLNFPGGKILLKLLEKIDHFLIFLFPFFKKYSFKIVFIFSQPK